MEELLKIAFEYGQKFEGRGGDENYSFEQFLADNNQALQLQQTGVSDSSSDKELRDAYQEGFSDGYDQAYKENCH